MMNDLETLRPEVRSAFSRLNQDVHLSPQSFMDWNIIRAELLRLAALEHAWHQWIKDGMRVDFLSPEPPK